MVNDQLIFATEDKFLLSKNNGMGFVLRLMYLSKSHKNIRLEQKLGELQNIIQESRLIWFGQVMRMGEETIHKKMLHTKVEGRLPKGRPLTRRTEQIRNDIEMRGDICTLAAPDLWNRMQFKFLITMVFICLLLSCVIFQAILRKIITC